MSGEPNQVLWRGVQPVSGIQGIWPAIDSVRVNESASRGGAGDVIIYTVPANKKLFISTINLSSRNNVVQDSTHHVSVRNDSDVEQYKIVYHLHSIVTSFASNHSFLVALEASAGWDVVLTQTLDDTAARAFLFGWLEDE